MLSTWPLNFFCGNASTSIHTGWPGFMCVSCVSLKLAVIHTLARHDRQQRLPHLHVLALLDHTVRHPAVFGRGDVGVGAVQLRLPQRGFGLLHARVSGRDLRLVLPDLRVGSIRFLARFLQCRGAGMRGRDGRVNLLARYRPAFNVLIAREVGFGSRGFRFGDTDGGPVLFRFGARDNYLMLGLRQTTLGRSQVGARLGQGHVVVTRVDLRERVALFDKLIVVDEHRQHVAGHLGADLDRVPVDERIVGRLVRADGNEVIGRRRPDDQQAEGDDKGDEPLV